MAATNRYISLNPGNFRIGKVTETALGTPTDEIELRMLTTKADGVTKTNQTRMATLTALEVFKAYLVKGGINEFMNIPTPQTPAFSDATKTATTAVGSATLTALSANVNTAGWKAGMSISGGSIPANTTILAISTDGLQVFMSANATAAATLVAITVTAPATSGGLTAAAPPPPMV